jgi:small subunit ribosomal protein S7
MRRSRAKRRWIDPDPKFGSLPIARFTNVLMERGKKSVAQKVIYGAFDIIKTKTKTDPLEVFDKAVQNVGPLLEVKGRRIGGANYQIPQEVHGHRRDALAFRWIKEAAGNRKGNSMREKLAAELMDAAKKEGNAIKKRAQVHKMAEANKAFAHFATR